MHYPCSEKPRIWSLAHTAAAGAVEGATPNPPRPRSPECRVIPGQPAGAGGQCAAVPRNSGCEQPSCVAKAFGNRPFATQGMPMNCAPCPRRREPAVRCQYPSGAEGSWVPNGDGCVCSKDTCPLCRPAGTRPLGISLFRSRAGLPPALPETRA